MTAIQKHDAAAQSATPCAANDSPALSPFLIRIGPRGAPRVEFGAMTVSAASAFMQHFDLCEVNERCEILAVRP